MKNINYKAIIIGNIVDILGTSLVSTVAIVIMMSIYNINNISPKELTLQMDNMISVGASRYILYTLGIIMSIFAGYVSARIAKKDYIKYGATSSIFCVSGEVYSIFTNFSIPLRLSIPMLFISPILGTFGGYLYGRYKNR